MTEPHRATPEQEINELIAVTVYGPDGGDTPSVASAWEVAKLISGLTARVEALWEEMRDRTDTLAAADGDTTSLIFKVTNRIEALEAAQLEQAESHRFCTDAIVGRVEALELARRIQSGTLTPAEQAELGVVPLANLKAAVHRAAAEARDAVMATLSHLSDAEREQVAQELASPAAWRPLNIETTYGSEHAADSVQMTHPRMVVEGTFNHGGETYRYKANATPERDPTTPEPRPASAEVQPAASEIFPVEYADANGEGIRIIMEPADETGRVCWVVRNSRRVNPIYEFPTPEAAYAAHQARAEDEGNHD
jgi:hypothetical protein